MKKFATLAILAIVLAAFAVGRQDITPSVTLAWNPSPSAGVNAYNLYVGGSPGTYTNVTHLGNVTTCTFTNMIRGQTYYFAVTALAGSEESVYSNEVHTNTPALPLPPTINVTGTQ